MNCPKCGNELSPGWMVPRKICYLEWAPEHWYFPLLPKNKVRLNPTPVSYTHLTLPTSDLV